MPTLPSACVIGAGPSGLTACKALKERKVPFECFEAGDDVGGVWYMNNPNGMSSAYERLHINTSKKRMELSDFPMPEEWPVFPHHSLLHEYFRSYCDHFGLREHIRFSTRVEHAERHEDGVWTVRLSNGEVRQFDALFVANGHHWDPRWPEPAFPGSFDGEVMHAHYFRTAEPWRGKRVCILGMGNSAMDIAVEASYVASKVYLAARRGAHVIPKYMFGRPMDSWVLPGVPLWLQRFALQTMLRLQVGSLQMYGLPKPDHRLLQAHPTISSNILDRIGHGAIQPKPNLEVLEGDSVRFADGSVEPVDVLVYATGYKVSFPFFDTTFLAAEDNDLPLFRRMVKPGIPNLFFIGLLQPLGAIFPLSEQQAALMADYLVGRYALPDAAAMEADIERERAAMFRRYVKSKRHTMQVDFFPYLSELGRERAAGEARARRRGNVLPIPPQAAGLPAAV